MRHLFAPSLLTAAALISASGCAVNLSMQNDLPYPIAVTATDITPSYFTPTGRSTRPQIIIPPGEKRDFAPGDPEQGIAPFRSNRITFSVVPQTDGLSWSSCLFTFDDPSPVLHFRIATTNDGTGTHFIEARDALGILQPPLLVSWGFTGNGWRPDAKND